MYKYMSETYFNKGEGVAMFLTKNATRSTNIHIHDFIEIVYICDGTGTHRINDVSYRVKKGDLLFINYKQTHSITPDSTGMSFYNLMLRPELFGSSLVNSENAFELLSLTAFEDFANSVDKDSPFVSLDDADMAKTDALFTMLYEEYRSARLGRNTMINSIVMVLLLFIFRAMSHGISKDHKLFGSVTDDILSYIESHCHEKLTLQDLAERCFYTPSYFSRLFKETYSMTLTEYITKARIDKSIELLKKGEVSVDDVCYAVGFTDKTRFYRYFREHTGLTPAEYRKKNSCI